MLTSKVWSGASRRRTSGHRLGRLAVRLALGRRFRTAAGGSAQSPGRRDRSARLKACESARLSDSGSRRPGRGRSGCCGRAPAPRIRPCPTPTTSRRSPPKTRSTPCRRRPACVRPPRQRRRVAGDRHDRRRGRDRRRRAGWHRRCAWRNSRSRGATFDDSVRQAAPEHRGKGCHPARGA